MLRDEKLSSVLHALLHMAAAGGRMTSQDLAACLHTNPVVVRRTMGLLREAGFVSSERGPGGGWAISPDWRAITLLDIHNALGRSTLLTAPVLADRPTCVVEAAVKSELADALTAANALLAKRLAEVTLGDLEKQTSEGMKHARTDSQSGAA